MSVTCVRTKLNLLLLTALFAASPSARAEKWDSVHQLTVDYDRVEIVSEFELGWTWTHMGMDGKNAHPAAARRGAETLKRLDLPWQNTHIIGWGVGNLQREQGGELRWGQLDARIRRMEKFDSELIITLCTAPGWMKRRGDTWNMEDRQKPEHFDEFAELCVEVAKRYPQVRYYQVWNELKGFWSKEKNNWDIELYTEMYNKVYDALKAHDPTLVVGGLYTKISGTGSDRIGYDGPLSYTPLGPGDRHVLRYWLENMSGADFICIDRGTNSYHDKNAYTAHELIGLTDVFSISTRQTREMTDLPIWWSEYYGSKGDPAQIAAGYASIYYHMAISGSAVVLCWNPFGGEVSTNIMTSVKEADGAQPVEHMIPFRAMREHFSKGANLYATTSSTPRIEVMASDTATMVINKYDRRARAELNGQRIKLDAYEVLVIENPGPSETVGLAD